MIESIARDSARPTVRLRKVILIHGINSTGEWQEQVESLLSPHFECVVFKYSEFQKAGAVKAALAKTRRKQVVQRLRQTYERAYDGCRPA